MRIVTFNVNGFRGLLNQGESIDGEASCNNLQKLKDYIDGLKINAEDVVILQEIPHMYLVDKSVLLPTLLLTGSNNLQGSAPICHHL